MLLTVRRRTACPCKQLSLEQVLHCVAHEQSKCTATPSFAKLRHQSMAIKTWDLETWKLCNFAGPTKRCAARSLLKGASSTPVSACSMITVQHVR
jgi:hypothetical protein